MGNARTLSQLLGTFLAVMVLLLCAPGARADIYDVTLINVTFSATCIGGSGTCSEVVNGSGLYDSVNQTVANLSAQLTGSYNVTLDGFANPFMAPACSNSALCLSPNFLYDLATKPGFNPIEFGPDVPNLNSPTGSLASDTVLFMPGMCGGNQAKCGATGAFPTGKDFLMTSGTYTSVDEGPSPTPEPSFVLLTGLGMAGLVLSRRLRKRA